MHLRLRCSRWLPLIIATFVHAKSDTVDQHALLDGLRAVEHEMEPWIAMGNLNVILNEAERRGGDDLNVMAMKEFSEMITDCAYVGCWERRKYIYLALATMWQCLNLVLISQLQIHTFALIKVKYMAMMELDHQPLLISLEQTSETKPSYFHFMNMWSQHSDFWEVVE